MSRSIRLVAAFIAGLMLLPLAPAPEAHADSIRVGSSVSRGRSISCSQGQQAIRNRGFHNVNRRDCRGRFFVYTARRNRDGRRYEIVLNRHNGRVVDRRRR
jgi:hypothetical protein